jgi:hypothetical protein
MADYACASCAGPVSEGRCPTCRVSRETLRQTPQLSRETLLQLLAALVLVLTVLAIAVERTH